MPLSEKVRSFLMEKPRFPVLATVNPDGTIQQSVMWFDLEGDQVMMNTLRGRHKERNLRSNDVVSLCFEEEGRYVTLSGRVTVVDDPVRGQADIRRLAVRYDGEAEAERMVESVFGPQDRVTLLVTIEKVFVHGLEQG